MKGPIANTGGIVAPGRPTSTPPSNPIGTITLTGANYGNGYTLIQVPTDLQSFDSIGITDEPGTGSQWPTTPRVIGTVWIGFDRRQAISGDASGGHLAAPVWGRSSRCVS